MVRRQSKFYAVRVGRRPGVYETWEQCRAQVERYQGSRYKAFPTRAEAHAFVAGEDAPHPAPVPDVAPKPAPPKRKAGNDDEPIMPAKAVRILPDTTPGGLTVYTDGSSRGNGRDGAVAGYGVYWSDARYHHLNLSCRLAGPVQTNNRAELTAILRAIETCPEPSKPLRIFTDSQYAMKAVTQWIPAWKRNGWRTSTGSDVQNKDLIVSLDYAFTSRTPRPSLVYVRAHAGTHGNEMADRYAVVH
ncbi:ribonuclease H [Malassezia brasiliensis]|uniref:ribonuclease H n=1 Tax=Malassezia brasiliensis TaxID=1821822 RepID=A0AAF0INV0_9BASI|nr:ribonuclease H [Malassezia brasiliensis]